MGLLAPGEERERERGERREGKGRCERGVRALFMRKRLARGDVCHDQERKNHMTQPPFSHVSFSDEETAVRVLVEVLERERERESRVNGQR